MVTFAGEREVLSESVVADGSPQSLTDPACRGERLTRWSSSGTRLFSSSTLTCEKQPVVKTTGLSGLVSADEWLDVQVADVGGREQLRTRRFWRSTTAPPAAVATALRDVRLTRPQVAATTIEDVIEASRNVASVGVEAWLAESRAPVPLDRRVLVQLSDAHVAPQVIDVLVALAYPEKFEVRRNSGGGGGAWSSGWLDDDPGEWGYLADVYGYGFGSFGVPYFMRANGYGYYPGDFWFVPAGGGGAVEDSSHGQVVNGKGYTRVQPREAVRSAPLYRDGDAQSASDAGGRADGGSVDSSSGSSGSSAASPGGYSGGGGTGTGLTAVPR